MSDVKKKPKKYPGRPIGGISRRNSYQRTGSVPLSPCVLLSPFAVVCLDSTVMASSSSASAHPAVLTPRHSTLSASPVQPVLRFSRQSSSSTSCGGASQAGGGSPRGTRTPTHTSKEEAKEVEIRLLNCSDDEIVCEGPVDKEENAPWRHHRVTHDWTANSKWHRRYLTLLNDGTLLITTASRDAVIKRFSAHQLAAHADAPPAAVPPPAPVPPAAAHEPSQSSEPSPPFLDISDMASALTAPPLTSAASAPAAVQLSRQSSSAQRLAGARCPALLKTASGASAASSPANLRSDDCVAGRNASRLALHGAICVRCAAGVAYGRRPYAFVIQTRSRDHYFAVGSVEEAAEWVDAITDAIAALEGTSELHHQKGHVDHHIDHVPQPASARQLLSGTSSARLLKGTSSPRLLSGTSSPRLLSGTSSPRALGGPRLPRHPTAKSPGSHMQPPMRWAS